MGTTATTIAVFCACLGLNPSEDSAVDEVDLIEINHFHDDQGKHVFDQVIFYDWSPAESRYQVRAWRMLKSPAQIPHRNWRNGGFDAVWHDSQNGDTLRKVHSQVMRESWTQFDPELVEREFLPKERRRELSKPARVAALTLAARRSVSDKQPADATESAVAQRATVTPPAP